MASELNAASLYDMAIKTAHAKLQLLINRDPAKHAELEKNYRDLRDEETAATVWLRLTRANNPPTQRKRK